MKTSKIISSMATAVAITGSVYAQQNRIVKYTGNILNPYTASLFYDNGTTVALGYPMNTVGLFKLDVNGNGRFVGPLRIGTYTLPNVDGTAGQVLKTNGAGVVTWQNASAGILSAANGLNVMGSTVRLGGTLDANTDINLNNFILNFTDAAGASGNQVNIGSTANVDAISPVARFNVASSEKSTLASFVSDGRTNTDGGGTLVSISQIPASIAPEGQVGAPPAVGIHSNMSGYGSTGGVFIGGAGGIVTTGSGPGAPGLLSNTYGGGYGVKSYIAAPPRIDGTVDLTKAHAFNALTDVLNTEENALFYGQMSVGGNRPDAPSQRNYGLFADVIVDGVGSITNYGAKISLQGVGTNTGADISVIDGTSPKGINLSVVRNTSTGFTPITGINVSCANNSGLSGTIEGVVATVTGNGIINYGANLSASGSQNFNYGVNASATGANILSNYGASLLASGSQNFNFGVNATASGAAAANYGIFAEASGASTNYAGYFQGDVFTTGMYLPSDQRLKENVVTLTNTTDIIKKLRPTTYTYKKEGVERLKLSTKQQYGLIAQELEKVLPDLVAEQVSPAEYDKSGKIVKESEKFKGINYIGLIPVLLKGAQEQQAVIEQQEAKISSLQARLEKLEKALAQTTGLGDAGLGSTKGNILGQNVPNPFERTTTINYQLAQDGQVNLTVYNVAGEVVATLVNQTQTAGTQNSVWNAENAPSGTYIYVLKVNGAEMVRKAILKK